MSRNRSRARLRICTWALSALICTSTAAWALSGWWIAQVTWGLSDWMTLVELKAGQVTIVRFNYHDPTGSEPRWEVSKRPPLVADDYKDTWFGGWRRAPETARFFWGWAAPTDLRSGGFAASIVKIPFWPFPLIVATPLIVILRDSFLAGRRSCLGLCPSCGYDQRGLAADAKCPECGNPAR